MKLENFHGSNFNQLTETVTQIQLTLKLSYIIIQCRRPQAGLG